MSGDTPAFPPWPDFGRNPQLLTRAGLAEAGASFHTSETGAEYAIVAAAERPQHLLFRMDGETAVPVASSPATSSPVRLFRIHDVLEHTNWTCLRRSLAAMRRHIERQTTRDLSLSVELLGTAPVQHLDEALRGNDAGEMIDIGRIAADWLTSAVPELVRRPWDANSPNWAILDFKAAARFLSARKPACALLEAEHPTCRFDAAVTHTVIQLTDADQPGVIFAPGLYLKHPGRWYVAELVREQASPPAEVAAMRLVAGPFESELTARFEQLYEAPMSIRLEPCDPTLLPLGDGAAGTPGVTQCAARWADQHFQEGTQARQDALNGYLAAMWSNGSHREGRGAEEWGRGWIAGCAARMLGYRGVSVSVQPQSNELYPFVAPLWMVVDTHSGEPVPSLTDIVTSSDATRLAVGYGVLEIEAAPAHNTPRRFAGSDPRIARLAATVTKPLEAAGYEIVHTGGRCLMWMKFLDPAAEDVLMINNIFGDIEGDPDAAEWIIGRSRGDDWFSVDEPYTLADAIRTAAQLPEPGWPDGSVMEETFPDLAAAVSALGPSVGA